MPSPLTIENRALYIGLGALLLVTLLGVVLDFLPLVFLPLGVVFILMLLYNLKWPYLLLFLMIPLSWEQEFSNGFGTDLPTEPLMVFLLGATLLYYMRYMRDISSKVLLNAVSLLLLAHYAWTWIACFFSDNVFVSVKFCLAKTWYIATFFFLSIIMLRHEGMVRKVLKIILAPLVVVVAIILYRHSLEGFSFESANFVMAPFFRNHVNSAALMSVFLPFVVYLLITTKSIVNRAYYVGAILILLAGIYFSYTRAAHISIFLCLSFIPVVKWRLTKWGIGAAVIVAAIFISGLVEKNAYLDYAPEFEQTVSHQTFEDLVSATYEGKDISTMERVYRWVAAFHMFKDQPFMGFGPGNFYNFYKAYTVTTFRTYVSDNPEKSGVHCYYLMLLVEQGVIGLMFFLLLLCVALLKIEDLYHKVDTRRKRWFLLCLGMSMVTIILFQLINDLIETDKIGSIFFMSLACIVVMDLEVKGVKIFSKDSIAE